MGYRALCVAIVLSYACVANAGVGGAAERHVLCGSRLADMVSSICSHTYNDPRQYTYERSRVKRDVGGIADECCSSGNGCTVDDLLAYCFDDENIAVPSVEMAAASSESHVIADRSAEAAAEPPQPAPGFRSLFGRVEMRLPNVSRGAPVVGTVSPLVVYGTLPDEQPSRKRLLYVTV